MIPQIIEYIFGQKSVEKLLHRQVKVQFIVIIGLIVGTAYLTAWFLHFNGEWKTVKTTVAQNPVTVSNAVVQAVAPVIQQVGQLERQQNSLSKQVKNIEATGQENAREIQDNSRKVDKLTGYIEGKNGQLFNENDTLTRGPVAATVNVVTNAYP